MRSWVLKVRSELAHMLPAIVFFFVAFNLINMTEALMLKQEQLTYANMPLILLGAAIVAKTVVIIDTLPGLGRLPRQRRIVNILWKAFLYGSMALLIRLLTVGLPYLVHSSDWSADWALFIYQVDWTRFWAIQIWFYVLFFLFVFLRDLIEAVGIARIKHLLWEKQECHTNRNSSNF